MTPALPIEIFYSVIQSVDAVDDLLVLALCCSQFRTEAQRLLFRYPATSTHDNLMWFIYAVCSASSRLGPLVLTFTMEYDPGPDADLGQDATFIAFALSAMCNLKQIEHRASSIMPVAIYKNCRAPLESIRVYGDTKTTTDISSLIYDVLPTQPSLTHIIMDCSVKGRISSKLTKAAADLCPNLVSLSVGSAAVGKMLLQRKKHLQSLQWTVGTSTLLGVTVPQYNHLNYLMLLILTRGLDTSFAQHLTSLALLELCFSPSWNKDILISEMEFIAQIPHLQYLILYGGTSMVPKPPAGGQPTDCPEVALRVFKMRKTLKHIDLSALQKPPNDYLRVFAPLNTGDVVQSQIIPNKEVDSFRNKYSLR